MSREAGRVRALENAARLQFLLEARDRVELFGYAITRPDTGAVRMPAAAAETGHRDPPPGRVAQHLDA